MFFFQIPWLPEFLMRLGNWRGAIAGLKRSSLRETFTQEDFEKYREAWSQPGAFRSMLNWYRAVFRKQPRLPSGLRIRVPTLMLWGCNDIALGRDMAQPSIDYCDDGRLEFFEKASHWIQHDEPDRVNRLIIEFFAESRTSD